MQMSLTAHPLLERHLLTMIRMLFGSGRGSWMTGSFDIMELLVSDDIKTTFECHGLTVTLPIPEPSPSDRQGILILLQYHLHKLYVLSIYHPARGFDLSSANIRPVERHELLVSARAVLRLRQDDASIWSNWDLIVSTPSDHY